MKLLNSVVIPSFTGVLMMNSGAGSASTGAAGTVLRGAGAGVMPTWGAVSLTADVSGDLPFANLAQIATNRLVGRQASGTGDIEALSVASNNGIAFDWATAGTLKISTSQDLQTTAAPAFSGMSLTGRLYATHATAAQIQLRGSSSTSGVFMAAVAEGSGENEGYIGWGAEGAASGGAVATWTARATSTGILHVDNGTLSYYADGSTTQDATFTPTLRLQISAGGTVTIPGSATINGTTTLGYAYITNADARLTFYETDASTDKKRCDLIAQSDVFNARFYNDAASASYNWLSVSRTAEQATIITLASTTNICLSAPLVGVGFNATPAAAIEAASTSTQARLSYTRGSVYADLSVNASGVLTISPTGSKITTAKQIESTLATGTAPFAVTSTTACTNLNADLVDGQHASYFLDTSSGGQTKSGALTLSGLLTQTGELLARSCNGIVHSGNLERYYEVSRRLQAISHQGSSTVMEIEAWSPSGGYAGALVRTVWTINLRNSVAVTRYDDNGGIAAAALQLKILSDDAKSDANGVTDKHVIGLIAGSGTGYYMIYIRARFLESSTSSRWCYLSEMATATPTTQSGSAMTYSGGWAANTGFTNVSLTETQSNAKAGTLTLVTALTPANGGTGQSSYTVGDILYASAATTLGKLAGVATGNALISGGASTAPSWGKIGLTTHVSGTLAVGNGGTGATTLTQYGVLLGNGTNAIAATAAGSSGQLLIGQGSANPSFQTLSGDATLASAGVLTIGTGAVTLAKMATMASNRILGRQASGTGAPESLSLTGDNGIVYYWSNAGELKIGISASTDLIIGSITLETASATDALLVGDAPGTGGYAGSPFWINALGQHYWDDGFESGYNINLYSDFAGTPMLVLDDAGGQASLSVPHLLLRSKTHNGNEGELTNDSAQLALTARIGGLDSNAVRTVFTQHGIQSVTNTTTESTLIHATSKIGTLTIPANHLKVGKQIRIRGKGYIGVTGSVTFTLKLKTTSGTLGTFSGTLTGFSNEVLDIDIVTTVSSVGASGSLRTLGSVAITSGSFAAPKSLPITTIPTNLTVDTTAAQTLDITATWGTANVNNTVSLASLAVELRS